MVDFIPHLCQILIYEACSSSTKIFQLYVTPNVFWHVNNSGTSYYKNVFYLQNTNYFTEK